jgi:stress response protein YsnF
VQVRKEVEQDTVEATDTVRREELEVKTEGESDRKKSNPL